ncbi:MAG: hypothetical protein FJZ62_02880 [Chlamydiae bacterium]|nr:hypothetical protein [Chlamydiota bacterium]
MLWKNFQILFKIRPIRRFVSHYVFSTLLLTGCQYQFVQPKNQPTIELSFKGPFTLASFEEEMRLELQRSTGYQVVNKNGRYLVEISVDQLRKDTIGFLHDRQPITGEVIDRLFPNEGRAVLGAKITIIDKHDLKSMIENRRLFASADFDFTNPNTLRDTQYEGQPLVEYSLGQFDSEYGAYDVASLIAKKNLAKQLALYLGGVCLKK